MEKSELDNVILILVSSFLMLVYPSIYPSLFLHLSRSEWCLSRLSKADQKPLSRATAPSEGPWRIHMQVRWNILSLQSVARGLIEIGPAWSSSTGRCSAGRSDPAPDWIADSVSVLLDCCFASLIRKECLRWLSQGHSGKSNVQACATAIQSQYPLTPWLS